MALCQENPEGINDEIIKQALPDSSSIQWVTALNALLKAVSLLFVHVPNSPSYFFFFFLYLASVSTTRNIASYFGVGEGNAVELVTKLTL